MKLGALKKCELKLKKAWFEDVLLQGKNPGKNRMGT